MEQIHNAALQLVDQVGLSVPHAGILKLLTGLPGVSITGQTVRFAPELVERAMEKMNYPAEVRQREWGIISGAYALNYLDMDTRQLRAPTSADLRDMTKLCDSLGLLGSAPIKPRDIASEELQELALYKISYENSRQRSSDILDSNPKSTAAVAEYAYQMAQAAGCYFSLGLMVISPFRLMESELELIYHFLDRKVPMVVTALPSAGATGPLSLVGAHTQSLAELMAAMTLLDQVSRGGPVYASLIDSIRAHPFDMKKAAFVYGSAEDLLGSLLQCQLNRRYGIPIVAKSLLTTAKGPDAHAGAEKASHTLAAALAGAQYFTNAGVLAVDEVYSPEQVVIDVEIVQYVRRVLSGLEFSEEAVGLEAIKEVGIGGNFLIHPTTLSRYRTALWDPALFEHSMLSPWKEKGAVSLRDRAREIARKQIAQHTFELPSDVQRDLDDIWAHAQKTLA